MSQLDAINLANILKNRLVDFCMEYNFVKDIKLNEICRNIWSGAPEKGGLISDLWVEGAFPGEAADKTLKNLAQEGILEHLLVNQLNKNNVFPDNRKLYTHQLESILKSIHSYEQPSPGLVITAGTGAGKTEAFLFPMLNRLIKKPRKENEKGIRALILYPMNALVNDQVERIYEWLKGPNTITDVHCR